VGQKETSRPTVPPPHRPTAPPSHRPNVWAIDTQAVRDRFLEKWREPITTILDRGTYLDAEDIRGLVDATLPGADEIFALLALGDVLARTGADAYQRIVVDTAPTGHTLRLLGLPQSFDAIVRLLDAMQAKHRFMVSALTHRYRADAADALITELRERVRTLQATLTDPKRAAAVLVARHEHVVIAESKRYLEALKEAHIAVAAAVVMVADGDVAPFEGVPQFVVPKLDSPLDALDHIRVAKSKERPLTRAAAPRSRHSSAVPLAKLSRSLTIVAGKGGVGKTTIACALAISVAESGKTTLLVSTDPAPSIGDALAEPIGDEETPVPDAPKLVARQMDATAAFAAFRDEYRGRIDGLFDSIAGKGLDVAHDRDILRDLLALAPPGIDELYALSFLGAAIEEKRFECIIVDPAPTGHLLRLLEMPALAVAWSHQLMRLMLKYKDVVGLGDAAQELLGFAKRTRALDGLLHDAGRCAAIVVTLEEPLVRGETERLLNELTARKIPVSAVVTNRCAGHPQPLPVARETAQFCAPRAVPPPVGLGAIRQLASDIR
jgi:arsenite-transporting ATPase